MPLLYQQLPSPINLIKAFDQPSKHSSENIADYWDLFEPENQSKPDSTIPRAIIARAQCRQTSHNLSRDRPPSVYPRRAGLQWVKFFAISTTDLPGAELPWPGVVLREISPTKAIASGDG